MTGGRVRPWFTGSVLPCCEVLPDQDVDRPAVLGVHHDQRARIGRALHRLEDRRVVEHEHARVRHEELERSDPFADEGVHLLEDLVVDLPHDHVEAVVDVRLLRLLVPPVEPRAQALAVVLQREVDDRRGAAERRGSRARSRSRPSRSSRRTAGPCGCGRRPRRASRTGRSRRSSGPASTAMPVPIAATFSPSTRTSAGTVSVAVTTVPPWISVFTDSSSFFH